MEIAVLLINTLLLWAILFEMRHHRPEARPVEIVKRFKQALAAHPATQPATNWREPFVDDTASEAEPRRPLIAGWRNPQRRAAEYERSFKEKLEKEAKEAANASSQ